MNTILQFLRTNGEQMDAEIAKALGMPKALVQKHISQLSSAGEVICCQATRFVTGKKIEELFAPSTLRDIPLTEGQQV